MRVLTTTTALVLASMAGMQSTAAPVAYYTASGVGGMGNVNAETCQFLGQFRCPLARKSKRHERILQCRKVGFQIK